MVETSVNGASEAAARREARRRRILENSENRLRKITGQVEVQTSAAQHFPHKKSLIDHGEHINVRQHENLDSSNTSLNKDYTPFNNGLFSSEVREPTDPGTQVTQTAFQKLKKARLEYIVLSFLVFILYRLQLSFIFAENILLPFFVLESTAIFYSNYEIFDHKYVQAALVLIGVPSEVISSCFRTFSIIKKCVFDLSLYMFFFIMFNKLVDIVNYTNG